VKELHQARADSHGDAHDDALAHTVDRVLLAVIGCIKLKGERIEIELKY